MAGVPTEADLSQVFGAEAGAESEIDPEAMIEDDTAGDDEALDMAIEEALNPDVDPMTRREAFKNAVRLCKDTY